MISLLDRQVMRNFEMKLKMKLYFIDLRRF